VKYLSNSSWARMVHMFMRAHMHTYTPRGGGGGGGGGCCGASGNLPGLQSVKLLAANSSSQYTNKGSLYMKATQKLTIDFSTTNSC
jgi:hypothetical protein